MPPTTTPARLTTAGAARAPRWLLLAALCAYIVAGLFGRDPWKTDDVAGAATMLAAYHEGIWAWPQVGGLTFLENGPLVAWVGAAAVWLAGPLVGELSATRLPNLLWFGLAAWALWAGTRRLAERPEAQPLALPFGGEPGARDYAQTLADGALLLWLATIGILLPSHESSALPVALACHGLAYLALANLAQPGRERTGTRVMASSLLLALALVGALLSAGLPAILPLLAAMLAALLLAWLPAGALRRQQPPRRLAGFASGLLALLLALLLTAGMLTAWWGWARSLPGHETLLPQWWATQRQHYLLAPDVAVLTRMLRDLPWFLWPTWPLALLALWRWRGWLGAPHLRIPLGLALGVVLPLLFTRTPSEADYLLLVIPCAALAAFALPTLRRGVVNTLDWFALMCFSLTLATVWLGWVAQHFGWPPKIAGNIARQTAGFVPAISWLATGLAVLVTLAWVALVRWRVQGQPAVLWRGAALMAGGLTATWLLLVLLWLPSVDYARSYRVVSGELAAVLAREQAPGECVRALGLGRGQRASLWVFERMMLTQTAACPLLLQQTSRRELRNGSAAYDGDPSARLLWQGARRADRNEVLRLLRLLPSHQVATHPLASHQLPSHLLPTHQIPSHLVPPHLVPPHLVPPHPLPSHRAPSQPAAPSLNPGRSHTLETNAGSNATFRFAAPSPTVSTVATAQP